MRRVCSAVVLGLILAGCQAPVASGPDDTSSPDGVTETAPVPPRQQTPMPPLHSAGPLTKAGVEVYMDAQEADLRSYLRGQGVRVARRGNTLVVTVLTDRLIAGSALSDWGDAFARAMVQVTGHFDHTAIEIACYTDARLGDEQSQAISQKRAKLLAAAFSGYGIAASRLTPSGLGATSSRSTNPNDSKNRRIEITITPQPK